MGKPKKPVHITLAGFITVMTPMVISREVGCSQATPFQWRTGRARPQWRFADKLAALAKREGFILNLTND